MSYMLRTFLLVYYAYLMFEVIHPLFFVVAALQKNKEQKIDKHDVHSALKALKSPVAVAPNILAVLYAINSGFRPLAKGMTAKVQLLLTILSSHIWDPYIGWSSYFLLRSYSILCLPPLVYGKCINVCFIFAVLSNDNLRFQWFKFYFGTRAYSFFFFLQPCLDT